MSCVLPVSPEQGQRVPPVLRVHFPSYILLALSQHRLSGSRGAIAGGAPAVERLTAANPLFPFFSIILPFPFELAM